MSAMSVVAGASGSVSPLPKSTMAGTRIRLASSEPATIMVEVR